MSTNLRAGIAELMFRIRWEWWFWRHLCFNRTLNDKQERKRIYTLEPRRADGSIWMYKGRPPQDESK